MIDAENKRRAESGLVALKVETFTLATGTSSGSSSSDVTQCKVGDLALSPATTSASSGILCSPGDIPQTQALATTPHLSDHHHKTIPLSRDYGHDVSSSSSRSGSLFAATPTSPTVSNTYTTVICSTTKGTQHCFVEHADQTVQFVHHLNILYYVSLFTKSVVLCSRFKTPPSPNGLDRLHLQSSVF